MKITKRQIEAVSHRGRNLQIVACAGSGKTEVMARRISSLLAGGEPPASVTAFTFTEKAAASLKARIYKVVGESMGEEAMKRLGPLFAGTIHSFCLRMLQDHAGEYGAYELLDEHRQVALLLRQYRSMDLAKALGTAVMRSKYRNIDLFVRNMDAVHNERMSADRLAREGSPGFAEGLARYEEALGRFRLINFGQVITRLVERLRADRALLERVRGPLKHLFVDEYQDVNPAQEELVGLLAKPPVLLTVVGDDDQSIYQWRGAHVGIIQGFGKRYKPVKKVSLVENHRSRPEIIEIANKVSDEISPRLPKFMKEGRKGTGPCVFPFRAQTPEDEAASIGKIVSRLKKKGFRYGDMAVLLRSVKTSAKPFQDAFDAAGVPWTCSGRSGLFRHPEANALGRMYAFLVDWEWEDEDLPRPVEMTRPLVESGMKNLFGASPRSVKRAMRLLGELKGRIGEGGWTDLVSDYYDILSALGVREIRPDDPEGARKLSVLGRFSNLLTDFEHVSRRARPVPEAWDDSGRTFTGQKAGAAGSKWYFGRLCGYLRYHARDKYEDEAPQGVSVLDAVRIMTVHQAKGLEFPVVFVPCLVEGRFPSSMAGRKGTWLAPLDDAQRGRYEGGEQDERRLFYVAATRAREVLYLSCFGKQKNRARPSRFLAELFGQDLPAPAGSMLPGRAVLGGDGEDAAVEVPFSELMWFRDCPYSFHMRKNLGFQPPLVRELGYGSAIHHILRLLADEARDRRAVPSSADLERIADRNFYIPFANREAFRKMRASARRLIGHFIEDRGEDLLRVLEAERRFEIPAPGLRITGKADVILEGALPESVAIVDYKTGIRDHEDGVYDLQLQVYAAAARLEGMDPRRAYVYDLKRRRARDVPVGTGPERRAVDGATALAEGIAADRHEAKPSKKRCRACDVKHACRFCA